MRFLRGLYELRPVKGPYELVRFKSKLAGVVIAGLVLSAGPASASPIVDQSFLATGNRQVVFPIIALGVFAQTFTVGMTGILTGADFSMSGSTPGFGTVSDIRASVFAAVGGLPSGSALTTGLISGANISTSGFAFAHTDFSTGLAVSPGQSLALVLGAASMSMSGSVTWNGSSGAAASYSGGAALILGAGWGPLEPVSGADFGFRTYVDPASPVPEPGTAFLLVIGLAAVAVSRRFARRA